MIHVLCRNAIALEIALTFEIEREETLVMRNAFFADQAFDQQGGLLIYRDSLVHHIGTENVFRARLNNGSFV